MRFHRVCLRWMRIWLVGWLVGWMEDDRKEYVNDEDHGVEQVELGWVLDHNTI